MYFSIAERDQREYLPRKLCWIESIGKTMKMYFVEEIRKRAFIEPLLL